MRNTVLPPHKTKIQTSYHEIESQEELKELLDQQPNIEHCAFQSVDFVVFEKDVLQKNFHDCLFLGCKLNSEIKERLDKASCLVFPKIQVPYNVFRGELYHASSLYKGYEIGHPESLSHCFDQRVYQHYLEKGKRATDIKETLARSLHDHAMSNAMYELLAQYPEKKVVGMMGGHGLLRTDPIYQKVVYISKTLTEKKYLMVSGGGPGAMEATHLGAWMAGRTEAEVEDALQTLSKAPGFTDRLWLDTALQVMERYPQTQYYSLGVPTWLYGHEPTSSFATHIAKYFENAIREDGILTIAKGGIIYAPGSAGTIQEIFQDAVQNHYLSFGYSSPMVFLGKNYWTAECPIYTLLEHLMQTGKYKNLLLSLSDDIADIADAIQRFTAEMPNEE